jgi:hypothetical protein
MFSGVTGKNRITFLLPTLSPTLYPVLDPVTGLTLRPTPRPTQKGWAIWWLCYWRLVVGELGTWVFLCFPSIATELLTTRFGLLSREIIDSLNFGS